MLEYLLPFLMVGAVAGVLAGLFGVGGGLIIVPALGLLLSRVGVGADIVMHVAIGTSLSVIAVTSLSSTWTHHRLGGVHWRTLRRYAPGLAVGAAIGAMVADQLASATLRTIVGVGALLVAAQLLLNRSVATVQRAEVSATVMTAAGSVIGALSALIGIGGGSLGVPFLTWAGLSIRQAVGTSAAGGIPIAWAGTVAYMLIGADVAGRPALSVGYVSIPSFAATAVASIAAAPLGARLAHTLPPRTLKILFALLLIGVGAKLLLGESV